MNVRHRRRLPAGFVLGRRQWLFLLGINTAISLLPMVDGLAHLGGALGGALPMLVFAHRLEIGPRMRAACAGVATGLVLLYVAGIGVAAFHFVADKADPSTELAIALLATRGGDAKQLNDVAWSIAIDRASTPELLARAEEAARRAVAAKPNDGNLLDTRAYVLHRLGREDDACMLERRAAWLVPSSPIFTMLRRFLAEQRARSSVPPVRIERIGDDLVVEAPGHAGAAVYASVTGARRLAGLLRVVLPAGADATRAATARAARRHGIRRAPGRHRADASREVRHHDGDGLPRVRRRDARPAVTAVALLAGERHPSLGSVAQVEMALRHLHGVQLVAGEPRQEVDERAPARLIRLGELVVADGPVHVLALEVAVAEHQKLLAWERDVGGLAYGDHVDHATALEQALDQPVPVVRVDQPDVTSEDTKCCVEKPVLQVAAGDDDLAVRSSFLSGPGCEFQCSCAVA